MGRERAWKGAWLGGRGFRAWPARVLFAALALIFPVFGQSDSAPPTLAGFSFSPGSIDTSDGPASVQVTFHATDDLSGVASVRATFSNREISSDPRGCESLAPDTGTPLDGVYRCTVDFPRFSAPGTWQVFLVEVVDAATNQFLLTTSALAGMGFPTDLEVLTLPDTVLSVLDAFNFLPRALDTAQSSGNVRATFHVSDDRSGIAWAKVTFLGPGPAGEVRGCTSLVVSPGQEPALDVVLACDVGFPQSSAQGTWTVYSVEMEDAAGNNRQVSTAGLIALSFPTELSMTSQADGAPPELLDFAFAPEAIDAAAGQAVVQANFVAADDLTGVASVDAVFTSPGMAQQPLGCSSTLPDSGPSLTSTFSCIVSFPPDAREGIWKASRVAVRDAAGHTRTYEAPDLALAGYPVDLSVGFAPGEPRAVVDVPEAGRSLRGDSVTVAARLLQGSPAGVSPVAGVRLEYRPLPSGSFAPLPSADPLEPNPDTTYPYFVHWNTAGLPAGDYELRAVAHDPGGVPDPAPASTLVRIAGPGAAQVDEHLDGQGREECRVAVDGSVDVEAASGDRGQRGALARISLPAGSLAAPSDTLRILFPGAAGEIPRLDQPEQSVGVFVDLSLESGQGSLQPGFPAGMEITYADVDQDGVVDGTTIREEDLELRRLDETANSYLRMPPWSVLTEHNRVVGITPRTGRFALTGSLEPRVRFEPDATTLAWDPVPGALAYHVYRGGLERLRDTDGDGLPDGGYGDCRDGMDSDPTDAVFLDPEIPAGNPAGFFYLVTFVSPDGEKGAGTTSRGLRRAFAAPCP